MWDAERRAAEGLAAKGAHAGVRGASRGPTSRSVAPALASGAAASKRQLHRVAAGAVQAAEAAVAARSGGTRSGSVSTSALQRDRGQASAHDETRHGPGGHAASLGRSTSPSAPSRINPSKLRALEAGLIAGGRTRVAEVMLAHRMRQLLSAELEPSFVQTPAAGAPTTVARGSERATSRRPTLASGTSQRTVPGTRAVAATSLATGAATTTAVLTGAEHALAIAVEAAMKRIHWNLAPAMDIVLGIDPVQPPQPLSREGSSAESHILHAARDEARASTEYPGSSGTRPGRSDDVPGIRARIPGVPVAQAQAIPQARTGQRRNY